MVSALDLRSERSGFEPWPRTLCFALGQDTFTVPLSTYSRSSRKRTTEHPRDAKNVSVTELAAYENGCRKWPLEVYGIDGYMMITVYIAVLGLSFSEF